jgi:hypothetical protein
MITYAPAGNRHSPTRVELGSGRQLGALVDGIDNLIARTRRRLEPSNIKDLHFSPAIADELSSL